MRYIRITRVLNRREERYVLNRDVCYYCRATANEYFHSFTKRGSVDTRIRAIVKYNIGEFFFLLSNRTRNPIESRYPWILLHAPFLSPSKELIVRPARLRFNIIVLFRWTGIEKRRRRRWIYTVRFARALLSTRNPWRAPMESHGYAKESWYSKSYLFHYKLPTNHSLNPISTRNIANPIFINFFSPEQNQEYFKRYSKTLDTFSYKFAKFQSRSERAFVPSFSSPRRSPQYRKRLRFGQLFRTEELGGKKPVTGRI